MGQSEMANESCGSKNTSGDAIRGESAVDFVWSIVW